MGFSSLHLPRLVRSFFLILFLFSTGCSGSGVDTDVSAPKKTGPPLWGDAPNQKPACVRGIHLTSWCTGNKTTRGRIETLLETTELNTLVIAVKEIQGEVYIPGVQGADYSPHVYVAAIPDIESYLKYLKERGVYTIARVVVFKDGLLAKSRPEWAVKSSSPLPKAVENGFAEDVWVDYKGMAWTDPYNPWVWKYNIDIAVRAAELGFQEIQFDYIRFPSDGNMDLAVYSKPHTPEEAARILGVFLKRAHERLKPLGVEISIDVFGLAGSYTTGMGIGQRLDQLLDHIDVVSPMKYPSHYAPGELGVRDPNNSPYDIVFLSIRDTQRVLGDRPVALRPYLQDFSMGVKYTARHVRDQIQAAADLGVHEWLLWNPSCRYIREALLPDPNYSPPQD